MSQTTSEHHFLSKSAAEGSQKRAIRILLIEDVADDAEIVLLALKKEGDPIDYERVDSRDSLIAALDRGTFDAVISDYALPGWSGSDALRLVKARGDHIPFIVVSGTIGEEAAVQMLKAGADDYVMKGSLARLLPAVKAQLREADERKARRRSEEALRESEERFRQMAENNRDVFYLVDLKTNRTLYVSPAYEEIWGRSREGLYANTDSWTDAVHPDDRARTYEAFIKGMFAGEFSYDYRIVLPDGSIRWIQARGFPIRDAAGNVIRMHGVAEEVTERKEAEAKIRRLNRVYAVLSGINSVLVRVNDRDEVFNEACRIAVDHGGFPMVWLGVVDAGTMRVTPTVWSKTAGEFLKAAEHRISESSSATSPSPISIAVKTRRPFISNDVESDSRIVLKAEHRKLGIRSVAILPLVASGDVHGVLGLHAAEADFFNEQEMALLRDLAGNIAFALDHIAKNEKVNYLAYYDQLTGLANRTLFLERLEQRVLAAARAGQKLAVLILDVERFKAVNDAFGLQAGDLLLQQISQRFITVGGGDATRLARLGADHFAIVTLGVQNEDELGRLIEKRFQALVDSPYLIADQELKLSVKVGVALFPNDGNGAESLLRNAEAALKKAKQTGERYVFYAPEMTERIAERLSLESRLRQALERNEFVLHYQPKVDLESRRIVGLEGLIRWQTEDRGLVPPAQFIPLLEETGLILQVGAWALKQAALDHRNLLEQGFKPPRIAVNVSSIQLRQRDFVAVVQEAIRHGADPTGIDLELTESLIMEDVQANVETLKCVRALGINIAIDDFGTGYSSLGYLAKLPVQSLKIDRSFIVAMNDDPNTLTLVSTIISLAHSLRLKVIAEGVETEEQAKFLRLLRCDEMQGYLFSKPLPYDALVALLRTPEFGHYNSRP
jgi:diguanylate cyclase (GGDEF)-like protein/PAS domain S-box-containing protein